MKKILIFATIALVLIVTAFLVGQRRGYDRALASIERTHDTITVYKDHIVEKPVEVQRIVFKDRFVYVPKDSIVYVRDSSAIILQREQRKYADSTYTAWVSGADPRLDSIRVREKTRYITNTIVPKPRPNTIFVEATAIYDKSPFLPLTVNYGYEKNGLMIYGGAGYDFLTKTSVLQFGLRWSPLTW